MGLATDLRLHAGFEGQLPEFARLASRLADLLGIGRPPGLRGRPPAEDGISERLVRDYLRRGILSPTRTNPETGRGGIYGFRHLLELLAARVLLADGWPLDHIAAHLRGLGEAELLALIPGQPTDNAALALARRFRAMDRPAKGEAFAASLPPSPASPWDEMRDLLSARARLRAELPAVLVAIGADPGALTRREVACLEIAPWLTVLIDRDRLRRITATEAEAIGRAVAAALVSPTPAKEGPPR
ncbi:MerR family transcriptional regulator [Thermaurantiacus tibetensis]|uniref:MerR family transcriptional regulator n=1 Tax=Thermaurantiacus tibetensis TaxID=2759035 RepID=UPI00188DE4F0|nr:MerR family transcriptional regulator [Thermaurantiacus tibetensis]